MLPFYITNHLSEKLFTDKAIFLSFRDRLKKGNLTKSKNLHSHFCVHFVPYAVSSKKVFIGNHKKAGTWIFPGGHIEENELPLDTVIREMAEEMYVDISKEQVSGPFFFSLVHIDNPRQVCREHYDMWFVVRVPKMLDKYLEKEFLEGKWVDLEEAKKIITHKNNLKAIERLQKMEIV